MKLGEMIAKLRISGKIEVRNEQNMTQFSCETSSPILKNYSNCEVTEWFPGHAPFASADFTVSIRGKEGEENEDPRKGAESMIEIKDDDKKKINQGMKRIQGDSHFELVSGVVLPRKKIVQIWPEQVYENDAGFAVFICEVEGPPSEE